MPASASGNPAKRAAAKKAPADHKPPAPKAPLRVSTVEEWGTDEGELVELPSGKVVRIERIPLTTLLAENLLGDSLSVMAAKAVEQGEGMSQDEIREMSNDPAKVIEAMDAFDKIAARCIIEPEVRYYKDENNETVKREKRVPGVVYSDRIDLNDKIFLFQVISGGSTDLQRFRSEFAESVAGVSAG